MKAKLYFTESALPIILEALSIKVENGFVINPVDKEKIDVKNIIGFHKECGIITRHGRK